MPRNRNNHQNSASVRRRYESARARAAGATGDALNAALDVEQDAIKALEAAPATTVSEKLKKIDVLKSVLSEASAWNDGRDLALLESIRRDVQCLALGRIS